MGPKDIHSAASPRLHTESDHGEVLACTTRIEVYVHSYIHTLYNCVRFRIHSTMSRRTATHSTNCRAITTMSTSAGAL